MKLAYALIIAAIVGMFAPSAHAQEVSLDLQLPSTVQAGETVTAVVNYTVTGSALSNAVVSVDLSPGLIYVESAAPTGFDVSCTEQGALDYTCAWSANAIAAAGQGLSGQIVVTATVGRFFFPVGAVAAVMASVSADNLSSPASTSASLTVEGAADLALDAQVQSVSWVSHPSTGEAGLAWTYAVDVANNGNAPIAVGLTLDITTSDAAILDVVGAWGGADWGISSVGTPWIAGHWGLNLNQALGRCDTSGCNLYQAERLLVTLWRGCDALPITSPGLTLNANGAQSASLGSSAVTTNLDVTALPTQAGLACGAPSSGTLTTSPESSVGVGAEMQWMLRFDPPNGVYPLGDALVVHRLSPDVDLQSVDGLSPEQFLHASCVLPGEPGTFDRASFSAYLADGSCSYAAPTDLAEVTHLVMDATTWGEPTRIDPFELRYTTAGASAATSSVAIAELTVQSPDGQAEVLHTIDVVAEASFDVRASADVSEVDVGDEVTWTFGLGSTPGVAWATNATLTVTFAPGIAPQLATVTLPGSCPNLQGVIGPEQATTDAAGRAVLTWALGTAVGPTCGPGAEVPVIIDVVGRADPGHAFDDGEVLVTDIALSADNAPDQTATHELVTVRSPNELTVEVAALCTAADDPQATVTYQSLGGAPLSGVSVVLPIDSSMITIADVTGTEGLLLEAQDADGWFAWSVDLSAAQRSGITAIRAFELTLAPHQPARGFTAVFEFVSGASADQGLTLAATASSAELDPVTSASGAPLVPSTCPGSGGIDSDGDGLTDLDELFIHQTNPDDPDTDGDGLNDGDEVEQHLTDPLLRDTDEGGMGDGDEVALDQDPLEPLDDFAASAVGGGAGFGCDSAGAPLAPWSVLVLLGFGLLVTVRRRRSLLVVILATLTGAMSIAPPTSHAAGPSGFTTILFEPVPGRDRIFSLETAGLAPHLQVYGGLWFVYSDDLLTMTSTVNDQRTSLLKSQALLNASFGLSLKNIVAIEMGIPVVLHSAGESQTFGALGAPRGGDILVRIRTRFYGGAFDAFGMGASLTVHVPTGSDEALSGDGRMRAALRINATYHSSPVLFTASVGALIRSEPGEFRDLRLGHELLLGVGAKFDVVDPLKLGLELLWRTQLNDAIGSAGASPLELVMGADVLAWKNLALDAGVGVGLVSGYGAPDWRIFLGVQWISDEHVPADMDGDGIDDLTDKCNTEPEDKDGFEDGDGCPEPDNDLDGVLDPKDRCPTIPGGENASAGCPRDVDTDKDGLADAYDRCPLLSQGDGGRNGCPVDIDSDSDGILDMDDPCPAHAAGAGGTFGCPVGFDSDGDGLLDVIDKCPHDAMGGAGGAMGCPPGLDSDGDGLLDAIDRCPHHGGGSDAVMGCPPGLDSDGDGLLDVLERCPRFKGPAESAGCPKGLDSDGDGLLDEFDRCPGMKMGSGGLAGCPAGFDSDGDGILDMHDKCSIHASKDTPIGCPLSLDSDGDGLLDIDDQCPLHKPDAAGKRGCPSTLDSDGDGLLDWEDRCPLIKPGDGGGNGCPPGLDSDGDKVPDMSDSCLAESEDGEGLKPADGCKNSNVRVVDCKINIADNVFFSHSRAKLRKGARPILLAVAREVRKLASVTKLVVEGHTDSDGSAAMNMALSVKRATVVANALRKQALLGGIAVEPRGFGETKPVAPNTDNKGRAKNRRVEFRVVGGRCKTGGAGPSE